MKQTLSQFLKWETRHRKVKYLFKIRKHKICSLNPKGNQRWVFIGRTDAEAEALILWLPDERSQLIGKDPDVGRDWGQEEKGAAEDEKVGWHHQLNGHEFEQALRDSEGQGRLACYSPWGRKKSDTAEQLNNNNNNLLLRSISKLPADTRIK